MLPNFFVVGAQKSGTTSLHNYLADHPNIYLPAQKETKFFALDDLFAQGIAHYEASYFADHAGQAAIGEIDPEYMYLPVVLQRMSDTLPGFASTRFIFVLREPVARAYSHYLITLKRGIETLDFDHAIAAEDERLTGGYFEQVHFSYLDRGRYVDQLLRFANLVPRERMLVLLAEELSADPLTTVQKVFRFLGVDDTYVPGNVEKQFHVATRARSTLLLRLAKQESAFKTALRTLFPLPAWRKRIRKGIHQWNQRGRYQQTPALDRATRMRVETLYADHNRRLAKFLERDLAEWRTAA